MRAEALTAAHVRALEDIQAVHGLVEAEGLADELEAAGGWAVVDGDVLGVGGVFEQWRGTGLAWCILSRKWRRRAGEITGLVRATLFDAPFHRIETAVRCDFDGGHRWARRLGFELETPCARQWGPDRADYSIYVMVRNV